MELLQALYNLSNGVATTAGHERNRYAYKLEEGEIVAYRKHARTGDPEKYPILLDRSDFFRDDYLNYYTRGYSSFTEVEEYHAHPFFAMLRSAIDNVFDSPKLTNEKGEVITFYIFPGYSQRLIRLNAKGEEVPFFLTLEDINGTWTYTQEEEN